MSSIKKQLSRRQLLKLSAISSAVLMLPAYSQSGLTYAGSEKHADAAPSKDSWNKGNLRHLLPTVSQHEILIKSSFRNPLNSPPILQLGKLKVEGVMTDTAGEFWKFYVDQLEANFEHQLQILSNNGEPICDPWSLKTFPLPESSSQKLRVLAFTCAGGNERVVLDNGLRFFETLEVRHALLERGLSLKPDLAIANGDHIYWDQRSSVMRKGSSGPMKDAWLELMDEYGHFDRNKAVLGTENEEVLKAVANPQLADLYGVRFRSTPIFFLSDDHDLFDNDEASEDLTTLPPDEFMLDASRTTQQLYYPEFLADKTRPTNLVPQANAVKAYEFSEAFGTIRYGTLFEALLYDTKKHVSLNGSSAKMVPEPVEQWLHNRTESEDTLHLMHVPSTPIGWSAGKWGEWYPDVLSADNRLSKEVSKPYWPSGWWQQHQRIIAVLGKQKKRIPLIASGDLHAFAYGEITQSAELNFISNAIQTMCVGPLGSGDLAYPSVFRNVGAQVPVDLNVNEKIEAVEKIGFSILDLDSLGLEVSMYAWRRPEPLASIIKLQPFFQNKVSVPS